MRASPSCSPRSTSRTRCPRCRSSWSSSTAGAGTWWRSSPRRARRPLPGAISEAISSTICPM